MASPSSPCTGICKLDRAGVCRGCGRLSDEIAAWPVASDARRRVIVQAARHRMSLVRHPNKAPR